MHWTRIEESNILWVFLGLSLLQEVEVFFMGCISDWTALAISELEYLYNPVPKWNHPRRQSRSCSCCRMPVICLFQELD